MLQWKQILISNLLGETVIGRDLSLLLRHVLYNMYCEEGNNGKSGLDAVFNKLARSFDLLPFVLLKCVTSPVKTVKYVHVV